MKALNAVLYQFIFGYFSALSLLKKNVFFWYLWYFDSMNLNTNNMDNAITGEAYKK